MAVMLQGIDVSSHNPATYPTSGLAFVMVKATEGTSYVNPSMSRQAAVARTANLVLGFYHFLHTGNIQAQAQYFVDKCASVAGDVLVCDWEAPPGASPASNAEKDAFLAAVKKLRPDHRVMLYCNRDFWLNRDRTSKCGDGLWIADPSAPTGKPRIKAAWLIHQYGITGGYDRNVAQFTSLADMKKWAGYPAPAPKPQPPVTLASLTQRVSVLEKKVAQLESK